MNTYIAIFITVVFGIIFTLSMYEIGKAKGQLEVYREKEAYLKSIGRKKMSRWKPEKGAKYYYVGDSGMVNFTFADCDSVDEAYYKFGNVFRTEAEAEKALEQVKETLINFHKENE